MVLFLQSKLFPKVSGTFHLVFLKKYSECCLDCLFLITSVEKSININRKQMAKCSLKTLFSPLKLKYKIFGCFVFLTVHKMF